MIGINNFTQRLGNQMWQIAVADSLATNNNDIVSYPNWSYAKFFEHDFSPKPNAKISKIWNEPHFHYKEIPYSPNLAIKGYFQSYKYLNEERVKKLFKFKETLVNDLKIKHKDLLEKPNCSIHVRRGDYLKYPDHHPVVDLNYIMKAVKEFPKETIFLVFSDDTKWCLENFPVINKKFFIIENQTDVEDLICQTLCDNNIIANSSYSWWGAYLNNNPNNKVIQPIRWFGEAYANYNTNDISPPNWKKMSTTHPRHRR